MRSSIGMITIPITGKLWVNMPGIGFDPIPIPVLVSEWMV